MATRVPVGADMRRLAGIVGVSGTPGDECLRAWPNWSTRNLCFRDDLARSLLAAAISAGIYQCQNARDPGLAWEPTDERASPSAAE